jgi:ureidoglycolate lyase
MSGAGLVLLVEPLTAEAFAPFGEVIEPAAARAIYPVNAGTATRYHDLADIDTAPEGGRTLLSLFRAQARALPFELRVLERHPLGSQAFVPLGDAPFLVVVASDPAQRPRVFRAAPGQGVNYRRGTWHHALFALERTGDFLVIDRGGAGDNCDEAELPVRYRIESA